MLGLALVQSQEVGMVLLGLAVIFLIDGELCHIDAAIVDIGDEAGGNLFITVGISREKVLF